MIEFAKFSIDGRIPYFQEVADRLGLVMTPPGLEVYTLFRPTIEFLN